MSRLRKPPTNKQLNLLVGQLKIETQVYGQLLVLPFSEHTMREGSAEVSRENLN